MNGGQEAGQTAANAEGLAAADGNAPEEAAPSQALANEASPAGGQANATAGEASTASEAGSAGSGTSEAASGTPSGAASEAVPGAVPEAASDAAFSADAALSSTPAPQASPSQPSASQHVPTGVQKTEAVPAMLAPASSQAAGPQSASAAYPGSYYPYPHSEQAMPYAGEPAPTGAKKKRSWTTAALAAAAMAGLLFGGLIGGLAGFAVGERDSRNDAQLEQPYGTQPAPDDGQTLPDQQGQGIQQGEQVESAPGVVLVTTAYEGAQGAGTGMIVDKSGIVLTNYHVVNNSTEVTVTVADTKKEYTATVVGHNQSKDVAVLEIQDPPKDLETVDIAKKAAKKGDSVSAVGNGSGQGYLTSLGGTVTALDQSILAHDSAGSENADQLTGLIQTDADVVQGYSGGPLMNADGEVVGMTTAASTGQTSADVNGYAVPIKEAMEIVEKIRSGEGDDETTIGRNAALGVSVSTNTDTPNGGSGKGAVVQNVVEGSGAENAGIKQGEIITHLDGAEVTSASELSDEVRKHSIGDKVTLKVTGTDGESRDVEVKLGESTVN